MDMGDKNTNILLDTIRKELNSIIETSSSDKKSKNKNNNSIAADTQYLNESNAKPNSVPLGKVELPSQRAAGGTIEKKPKEEERLNTLTAAFHETQATPSIDADLQKMQHDLQQSYLLFQTIGEKFENINFGTLKSRIRNLQLSEKQMDTTLHSDMRDMLQQSYTNNQLGNLTTEMGRKFKQHPGEFGDIPELSEFFKACTQLERGLEQLKKQRDEVSNLGKRLCWAAGASYDRVDEIHLAMGSQLQKH